MEIVSLAWIALKGHLIMHGGLCCKCQLDLLVVGELQATLRDVWMDVCSSLWASWLDWPSLLRDSFTLYRHTSIWTLHLELMIFVCLAPQLLFYGVGLQHCYSSSSAAAFALLTPSIPDQPLFRTGLFFFFPLQTDFQLRIQYKRHPLPAHFLQKLNQISWETLSLFPE